MPPIDPQRFVGSLPYDAQYVGSYQPLLGWVGNSGKRKMRDDVGKAVTGMVMQMQVQAKAMVAGGQAQSITAANPLEARVSLFAPWLQPARLISEIAGMRAQMQADIYQLLNADQRTRLAELRSQVTHGGDQPMHWRHGHRDD